MYNVCQATYNDLETILSIYKAVLPEQWPTKYTVKDLQSKTSHYLVAKVNDKIVGALGYWLVVDEIHISDMGVNPAVMHKGVGRLLMSSLYDLSLDLGITLVGLEVRKNNKAAIALYSKYGLTTVKETPRYYKNGDDGLTMFSSDIKNKETTTRLKVFKNTIDRRFYE